MCQVISTAHTRPTSSLNGIKTRAAQECVHSFFRQEYTHSKRLCTVLFTEHRVQQDALQVKLHVEQGGIALPTHDTGAKMGWVVSITPRLLYSRERDQAPIAQEPGSNSELVLMDPGNFAPTGFRTSDRSASIESLHRLCHLGHWTLYKVRVIRLGFTPH